VLRKFLLKSLQAFMLKPLLAFLGQTARTYAQGFDILFLNPILLTMVYFSCIIQSSHISIQKAPKLDLKLLEV